MRGDEIIPLTPKEFDVLLLLINRPGKPVEKDELLEKVWPDAFVEEGTLTRNISWLRKKLAAAAGIDGKEIIETLPKRGYRFLPQVSSSGGDLLIEEQTVQSIQIEEVIEILPGPRDSPKALQPAGTSSSLYLWLAVAVLAIGLVSLFFYLLYASKQEMQGPVAEKVVPFTGMPGRESSPAFSPDGRQVVFAWDGGTEDAKQDIYIKLVGAGDPVRLTNTPDEEINPVFTPDGTAIAFVRVRPDHNEIVMIPSLGGAERKIYETASYASISFSPDGQKLAAADLNSADSGAGIFLIDLPSNEIKRVTTPEAPVVDHTPRFSPDGKSIAFIRHFSTFKREVFVVPAAGGEPRQITSDDVRVYGLAWKPGSDKLFFSSYRKLGRLNLWQTDAGGSEPVMVPTGSRNLQEVAIAPDGKHMVFTEEKADENIWDITPGSGPKPVIRSTGADHSQQISPDGSLIVFASDRSGEYEIWIADADGQNQRQLSAHEGSSGSPRFSPDGKMVAYDAQTAQTSDIYLVPVNGGAARRLTSGGKNNALPAWSADGQTIFFLSNRSGTEQIWKMPFAGGDAVQVTKQGAFEIFAAADGKTLYYSKGGGKSGLWQVGVDGSDERAVDGLAGAGGWRSWTVAGSGTYYTAQAVRPPFQIRFFDIASGRVREVAEAERSPLTYYSNLAVSPDGKRILYAREDLGASTIMLAELK